MSFILNFLVVRNNQIAMTKEQLLIVLLAGIPWVLAVLLWIWVIKEMDRVYSFIFKFIDALEKIHEDLVEVSKNGKQ